MLVWLVFIDYICMLLVRLSAGGPNSWHTVFG